MSLDVPEARSAPARAKPRGPSRSVAGGAMGAPSARASAGASSSKTPSTRPMNALRAAWRHPGAVPDIRRPPETRRVALSVIVSIRSPRATESPMFDKFHDECGVFGVYGHPEAAHLTYLGLHALQHRGQESAGIVSTDAAGVHVHRGLGLVADVFNANELDSCRASEPSATCATPRPAAAASRTPSHSRWSARPGRSRWPTTETWSTPTPSSRAPAPGRHLPEHQRHRGPSSTSSPAPRGRRRGPHHRGAAPRARCLRPAVPEPGGDDRRARSHRLPAAVLGRLRRRLRASSETCALDIIDAE